MPFRLRLTLALLTIAAIPLAVLGIGVRREMAARLDAEAAQRVEAAVDIVRARLAEARAAEGERVQSLARELAGDARFRLATASDHAPERRWLHDWTARAMASSGFTVLRVLDSTGAPLSEWHAPATGDASWATANAATFAARSARFTVSGGSRIDSATVAALSPDAAVHLRLRIEDTAVVAGTRLVAPLPVLGASPATTPHTAAIIALPDPGPTAALKASVARWIFIALLGTLLAAALAALLLGRAIAAPVVALAERSARLEREAALGELARRVNHDVKNGLAPIRNVLRHLAEVLEKEPASLVTVFAERRGTLETSVQHLDALARNYAKLTPASSTVSADPRPVVLAIAESARNGAARVDLRLPASLPHVRADAVALHRLLGNLVTNAVEALGDSGGAITIAAEAAGERDGRRVRFTVSDDGRGMTAAEVKRAFTPYHTTKPNGTGLGLAVVHQLLEEIGGSIAVDSTPGKGTTIRVEIPVA